MIIRPILAATLALASLFASSALASAPAVSEEPRGASDKVSVGTVALSSAPAVSLQGPLSAGDGLATSLIGGTYLVQGVSQMGSEGVEIILSSAANGARYSVKVAGSAAQRLALSAGTTVQAVSQAAGTLLVASGKVIAFIPTEVGKALLGSSKIER